MLDPIVQSRMARSLLGRIDVGEVLRELVDWMGIRFRNDCFNVLLSQDDRPAAGPIQPLHLRSPKHDLCSRSFIEGAPLVQHYPDHVAAVAPLKGKQANYGVLRVRLPEGELSGEDIEFMTALAEYAGISLETAKLYEQSTKLVTELRTIEEITKKLNISLQLQDVFRLADKELLSVFSADYCCILLMDNENKQLVVKASNAEQLLDETFDADYGFSGLICRSREPIIISDYQADKHVDSRLMELSAAKSLIGAPMIANSRLIGAILLVHREAGFFTFDQMKLLQVLAGHVGLAVMNANLHAELRRMVIIDQLTGLYVRHYLYEQITMLQKKDACGSLIVFDIDDFKHVNDTYGHLTGDEVLVQVSEIVRRNVRETDIAARWGGEELAVYLPLMNAGQAFRVAERIRDVIARETNPPITISSGIADWRRDDRQVNLNSLFMAADLALYEAKTAGKDQIRISS